jgi:hypothetical protein
VTAPPTTGRSGRPGFLFDGHRRELLSGSAIDAEVVAERGYRSVGRPTPGDGESRRLLARLSIPGWAYSEDSDFPGLLIPLYGPTGQLVGHQWKPRRPVRNRDGKPMKYASPKGSPNRLDVHPRNVAAMPDPTVELWVTEGIKKADALTSRGLCAIAITGVYNWRSQHGTLGEWEDVQLRGRRVVVCFDADARTNRNVARAMARFGRWLRSRGATVEYLVVPPQVGDTPVKGVDDFFAAGGSVDQLRAAMKATPPDLDSLNDAFTDSRMAETIADDVLAGDFVWLAGLGWLSWDGRVWAECSEATVGEALRQYVLERFGEESQKLAAGHDPVGELPGPSGGAGGGRIGGRSSSPRPRPQGACHVDAAQAVAGGAGRDRSDREEGVPPGSAADPHP